METEEKFKKEFLKRRIYLAPNPENNNTKNITFNEWCEKNDVSLNDITYLKLKYSKEIAHIDRIIFGINESIKNLLEGQEEKDVE